MLIDTHTHVVGRDVDAFPHRGAPLANGAWWTDDDCSIEAFCSHVDNSAVDGVVLVQAAGVYRSDNSYLQHAVEQAGDRYVGACIVDPADDDAVTQLAGWVDHERISGLRLFHIPRPSPSWLASTAGDQIVDAAADLGVAISVCCFPDDFADLAHQLERRPDVAIALDHCGFADFSDGAPFGRAQLLWELLEFSNLFVKITPTLVRMAQAEPAALVGAVVERFGASRVLWGSDWPQHREVDATGRQLSYAEQVDEITSWFDGIDASDRTDILGGNAQRLWPGAWNTGAST